MNTNSIEEVRQKIKELEVIVDKLEATERKQEPKPWPQVGDGYWFVAANGGHHYVRWQAGKNDLNCLATGNCHRTEAEAISYREWQTDPRVVARGMIERMIEKPGMYYMLWKSADDTLNVEDAEDYFGDISSGSFDELDDIIHDHPDLCKVALGVITDKEEGSRIVREAMGK